MKRCLIIRLGAIGDCIITTPIIKYLKQKGYHILMNTSETGMEVFQHNPYIDEFIPYKSDSLDMSRLPDYWREVAKAHKVDRIFNLTESIEIKLAVHPAHPIYNHSKQKRFEICNKNYYEFSFQHLKLDYVEALNMGIELVGDLHFTDREIQKMDQFFEEYQSYFKILLPISGSGLNKIYPYWHGICNDIAKEYKEVRLFTVGDKTCQLIEQTFEQDYLIPLSGLWSIRHSLLSTKHVNLVMGTDTGTMHAAGAYDTPKIIVFGHDTPENISKHFKGRVTNISSTVNCAPCFRLIYDSQVQCPRYEPLGTGCLCMTGQWDHDTGEFISGINPELVKDKIIEEIELWRVKGDQDAN